MALFLMMLPFYLLGNFHCLGMCGPLVMTIGQNRYRNYYFLGRAVSYSMAGFIAGSLGSVFQSVFKAYYLSAFISLAFGLIIFCLGLSMITGVAIPGTTTLTKQLSRWNVPIAKLMLQDNKWATFCFGFMTVLLPCGQTVIVFSACALYGSALVGFSNGLIFALLTSPSLFFSMQTQRMIRKWNFHSQSIMGYFGLIAGILGLCRGFADMGIISHWSIPNTHIAFF